MKILAIDQSLTNTGYWYDENKNGNIITSNSDLITQTQKISFIKNQIVSICNNLNPDFIIIEGYSYGSRNTKFTFTAGELGGAIKLWCYENNLKLEIVPPTIIKKFITGKGNSKKNQMLLNIYKKYGIEIKDDNIADAFSLNKFYSSYLDWLNNKNNTFYDYEIECFKKFKQIK